MSIILGILCGGKVEQLKHKWMYNIKVHSQSNTMVVLRPYDDRHDHGTVSFDNIWFLDTISAVSHCRVLDHRPMTSGVRYFHCRGKHVGRDQIPDVYKAKAYELHIIHVYHVYGCTSVVDISAVGWNQYEHEKITQTRMRTPCVLWIIIYLAISLHFIYETVILGCQVSSIVMFGITSSTL